MYRLIGVCLLLVIWGGGEVRIQGAPQPPAGEVLLTCSKYPATRVFNENQGLPNLTILTMEFDRRGYLWAGTREGAAYYNGRTWVPVHMPEPKRSDTVMCILPDADGALWFGTDGAGLVRLQEGKWSTLDTSDGVPNSRIRCLLGSTQPNGSPVLWVGTYGGLGCLENGKWKTYTTASGLPNNEIWSLFETREPDGSPVLWVGTAAGGLSRIRQGQVETAHAEGHIPPFAITAMLATKGPHGTEFWLGTFGGGVTCLANGKWTTFTDREGLSGNLVTSLVETVSPAGQRTIWAGTFGAGLTALEFSVVSTGTSLESTSAPLVPQPVFTTYTKESGLASNYVSELLVSNPSRGLPVLWVGANSGGLTRFTLGRWEGVRLRSGLEPVRVETIFETMDPDGTGVMWLCTDNGLVRLKNGVATRLATQSVVSSHLFHSLCETRQPNRTPVLWAGTFQAGVGGLLRKEEGKWTLFGKDAGLPDTRVSVLTAIADPAGRPWLWVATYGGGIVVLPLDQPVTGRFGPETRYLSTQTGMLPDNRVEALLETATAQGRQVIWVGTGGGLVRFEGDETTIFDVKSGALASNSVSALCEIEKPNRTRTLWVGTFGGGVAVLEDGRWTQLEGLPNNVVYQIKTDRFGRIYIFTNKGVIRLTARTADPRRLADFDLYTFTTEDGLPSNECTFHGGASDHLGRIWACTGEGLAVFDPMVEIKDQTRKPLFIERIASHTQTWAGTALPAELPYQENNLTFEFSLLSYYKEGETQYKTRLLGSEEQETDWTTESKRIFTYLPEGEYRFQVLARDYAGNISGPTVVAFRIKPAPWRTWWAYGLYGFLVVWAAVLTLHLSRRQLRRRNQLLEGKVRQRTAELTALVQRLKESEQTALEAKNRALEASHSKSLFLSNMSHELRTPLNAVLGFTQVLKRSRHLSQDDQEALVIISHSGQYLLELIDEVLSIAKIEAGKITLVAQPFNLLRMVQDLEDMFRLRAESKALQLLVDYPAGLPQAVQGDERKLRQVCINLLGNAFKFTESGGIAFRLKWENGRAFFEIEDTGFGISAAELPKLFTAFVQTESGRRVREGTGLGLMISQSFVRLMGGEILVSSELGKGTTFRFDIPLPQVAESLLEVAARQVIGLQPGQPRFRILIVDDKLENRLLLRRLLEGVGFEVQEAVDGRMAVELWKDRHPDLIWMDIRMPVMDGKEATREIRRLETEMAGVPAAEAGLLGNADQRQPARTVIIALTASAFEQEKEIVLQVGCDDIVTKPFREAIIFEKMEQFLDVRYQYAEVGPVSPAPSGIGGAAPAGVGQLAPVVLRQLQQALIAGDIETALAVIADIEAENVELGSELRAFVRAYRFEEIIEAIEKMESC
ncbi:MAG: response regulator [Blastocatellia bacterium]|nr:response regulator [Blastocatellia bacterium]